MSDPSSAGGAATAGSEFAGFVAEQLKAEEARATSLESRGLAVVTTSGTLVTILLALSALAVRDKEPLAGDARGPLVAALVAFVVAAVLGVATNAPQPARAVDPVRFRDIVRERWALPAEDARQTLLATRLQQLLAVQRTNNVKGWLLLSAFGVEGLAILFLAWTAVLRLDG